MSPDALQSGLQNPARAGMQQRYERFTCAWDYLGSFKGLFLCQNDFLKPAVVEALKATFFVKKK